MDVAADNHFLLAGGSFPLPLYILQDYNFVLIIDGNAFYEIDLECVKKKKQCAQKVHPKKKTDRINSRNMKDKDNIRQHE